MELKFVLYVGASPEKIWETLTQPEGTKATFFGSVIRSSFEEGSSYEYVGPGVDGDETIHTYGKILTFEPNKVFSCLEHPGPSYRPNHAELTTRITITLEPVGETNTTKMTLVNDQWTENHPSFETTAENWPMILSNIKTFAETGKTLDFGW
ncbi:SRPBCC domain-containing protein [Cohnella luojiensis]|uniref:Polyketide cyclase n=1 Tax=Cohnella luojiensis TaxID=652876 RepID=A0A4Y8LXU6_9BACL|nr:SRPBCC domain-containing protein [Cohnella luojiensis]TFE25946.1 polyketide cyclase [Cohnella luojiensis]